MLYEKLNKEVRIGVCGLMVLLGGCTIGKGLVEELAGTQPAGIYPRDTTEIHRIYVPRSLEKRAEDNSKQELQ